MRLLQQLELKDTALVVVDSQYVQCFVQRPAGCGKQLVQVDAVDA